jgi:hypothetical protein
MPPDSENLCGAVSGWRGGEVWKGRGARRRITCGVFHSTLTPLSIPRYLPKGEYLNFIEQYYYYLCIKSML